ncbi:YncE family protein [Silvibacterium sp.]|uniref:YncE family protein n=1 Tax=Silvibacterium sp. TaxID=1964179 RepID=UPI0039E466C3
MKLFFRSAVLASLLAAPLLHAQSAPKATLLALSKQDRTLSVIDPTTLQVIAKMPVGWDPHEVIASNDGRTAYVSNYGFGTFHTLAVVDLVNHKTLAPVDLGPLAGPHGLAYAGGRVWFTAERAKSIGRYDPSSKRVDWILGTGQNRTHMVWVSQDMQRIVTTNVNSGTVTIIEPVALPKPPAALPNEPMPKTDWDETVVKVGGGSEGFDVSPNEKEIWVANAKEGTISVISFAEKKVVATLQANVPSANRLKFTPDGKYVLVSCLQKGELTVLDAATRKVVKHIPIGHGAAGIVVQPDGARAYIACTPDNNIAVLDLHSWQVVGHINAGPGPDGMAWAVNQ